MQREHQLQSNVFASFEITRFIGPKSQLNIGRHATGKGLYFVSCQYINIYIYIYKYVIHSNGS